MPTRTHHIGHSQYSSRASLERPEDIFNYLVMGLGSDDTDYAPRQTKPLTSNLEDGKQGSLDSVKVLEDKTAEGTYGCRLALTSCGKNYCLRCTYRGRCREG